MTKKTENGTADERIGSTRAQAEFDLLADQYRELHTENVAVTGESPEYFSEYKVADLAALVDRLSVPSARILDFGSGIGNSLPFFRRYFSTSEITCADASARSMEVAQGRFPGEERYVLIERTVPLPEASQDVVFSACVFHHIPHEDHRYWLAELLRITRPGGLLVIYEHNPMNPLTVRAVNTCALDENAHLVRGRVLRKRALTGGWERADVDYKMFFPAVLAKLRPLERHLEWLGLGAQYRMMARRSL